MTKRTTILRSFIISCLLCGTATVPAFATAVTLEGSVSEATVTGNSDTGTPSGNTVTGDGISSSGLEELDGGLYVNDADDASNNTVTLKNSNLSILIVGGNAKNGQAEGNKVYVSNSDEKSNSSIRGGSSETGNVVGNLVEFDGGPAYNITGGSTGSGVASGNIVNVKAGTTFNEIHGGYSANGAGAVSGNTVTLDAVTGAATVITGGTTYGDAKDNTLTITKNFTGKSNAAYGGQGMRDVTGNKVTMSGGTVYSLAGGYDEGDGLTENNSTEMDGGKANIVYGAFAQQGTINDNKLTINDGTIGAAYGGYGAFGTVSNNKVIMSGGQTDSSISLSGTMGEGNEGGVFGGAAFVGTVENNGVKISGGQVGGNVYGGWVSKYADEMDSNSNVSSNTVEISNVTLTGEVYGGYTPKGDATGNAVTIESGTINNNVYGGSTAKGDANGNSVTIQGGTIEMSGGTTSAKVIGGESVSGSANDNTVTMTDGSASANVIGGYADSANKDGTGTGTANGNIVKISGGTVDGEVTGGLSTGLGSASGNQVTISDAGGIAENRQIMGGHASGTGTADNNILTLASGSVSGNAYGGLSDSSTATGNTVKVALTGTASLTSAVGGRGQTGASDNKVIMTSGTAQSITAGYAETGDASHNTVEMSGGTSTLVAAAQSGDGNATGNTVSMTGGTAWEVIAGYGRTGASGNTVTISGGTVGGGTESVFGGKSENGDAVSNTVMIKGGDVSGDVYGGQAGDDTNSEGKADNNTVTIESGNTAGRVFGGDSEMGSASGNTVTIDATGTGTLSEVDGGKGRTTAQDNKVIFNGGTAGTLYGGNVVGHTDGKQGAVNNTVEVNGGTVTMTIGGVSGVAATGNTVTVTGGDAGMVMGAMASGKASGNKVVISGGTTGSTYFGVAGGVTILGNDAISNTVTISGGEIKNDVMGGYVMTSGSSSGNANGNTVNFSGGTLDTGIYGGKSDAGAADDNTVNILAGTLNPEMNLYGGYGATESKNNTYNMYTKGQTVKDFAYFQNLNFYVPENTTAGETMLTVTGNANTEAVAATTLVAVNNQTTTDGTTDLTNDTVLGGVQRTTKLNPGEEINLLYNANGLTTDGTTYGTIEGLDTVTSAGFINHTAIVKKKDANTIILTIPKEDKGSLDPDTKVIPEDREHSINMLKNAADLLTDEAYRSAATAWEEGHSVEAKFVPYAVLGGHNLRYETGSYVDSDGMATNIGFVRRIPHTGHTDTIMPFFEYGMSHYDSHLDNGARGDGKQHYTGAGLLMRRDQADGLYYEGALRAGRVSGDFRGIIADAHSSYNTNAPYVAAQAGIGKIIGHGRDTYDYYGKFFWSHLGSDTTTVHSVYGDANYDLDSINSYRTRLGMRWTRNFDERRAFYAGLGWDYEFDSEANATYQGWRTESPTVKGSSGFLELGWRSKITKDNPWGVDLRLTGWAGKQHGATYYATISRAF